MSDLKPCPFCGDLMTTWLDDGHAIHRDFDSECPSECPIGHVSISVSLWNTRALPAVQPDDATAKNQIMIAMTPVQALEACRIVDAAVKEGHDDIGDLVTHLMSAVSPARAALDLFNKVEGKQK